MVTIQNKIFSASIAPQGAELKSLKNRQTGEEFIWSAAPSVWAKSAPLLFPIIGRLKEGKTSIQGRDYEIPKHGFALSSTFNVLEQEVDRVLFELCANDETRKIYPFEFSLTAEFKLSGNTLEANYAVRNRGEEEMLFSMGFHPAFALDLSAAPLSDYYIEFSESETLDLYGLENGLLVPGQRAFLKQETRILLSEETFVADALIFKNIRSRSIKLGRAGSDWAIEMDIRMAPHLGLWSKPGAAYVCIEPWFSYDDAADGDGIFMNKPGILSLAPGAVFDAGYTVQLPIV